MNSLVWTAELDNRYTCTVMRAGDYEGKLTVVDSSTNSVLLSKIVDLAYNAQFGPDAYDVMYWEELCTKTVDSISEREEP